MATLYEIRDADGHAIGRLFLSDDAAAALQALHTTRTLVDISPPHLKRATPGKGPHGQ